MRISIGIEKVFKSAVRTFHFSATFATRDNRVVLFGPSGSGKTLTLRAIAGLMRPDSGSISVDGRVLFDSGAGTFLPPR